MNFLNPLVLIGLVAATIPVLLHLLNLRKLKTVEFSSLKFLKELQKSKIRRLKIKQIMLLIVRTLLVIFAVIAFSRPIIEGSIPGFETYSKSSIVILIDNSFSMDVSDEYGNRFSQAKKSAEQILNSLKEGDEAVVIEMANPKIKSNYAFSRNPELIRQHLNEIKIEHTSASLDASLRIASVMLDKTMNFSKEVFVITDAQKNIFNTDDSLKFTHKHTGVYLLPIGLASKSDFENLSIDSLDIVTRIFQQNKPVEINAVVRNHSSKDVKGAVISLTFNRQKVAQRAFDILAGQAKTISIAAPSQITGAIAATVELENDALTFDNKRHFGFIIPDKPKVALIGNAESKSFINILFSADENASQVSINSYNPSDIAGLDLSRYDCIMLTSGAYSANDVSRMVQYANQGGSMMIFANEAMEPSAFANFIAQFGFTNLSAKNYSLQRPGSFTNSDKGHPLFEGVFKLEATSTAESIESPKIIKAYPALGGISLIEMTDGYFLSESKVGDGKVLYVAVPPNMAWSNFPVTSLFPALLYRSVFYLSSSVSLGLNAELGSKASVVLPKKFSANPNFKIIDPSGNEINTQLPILPSGAVLPTADWSEPGVYSVYNAQNKLVSVISLNVPMSESFAPGKDKVGIESEFRARFPISKNVTVFDDVSETGSGIKRARIGTELWQLFLLLAIMCAIAEMIIQKASKHDISGE